jgi:hypothetical protein
LSVRGTRAQYSSDNKNELHGGIPAFAPDETILVRLLSEAKRLHAASRRRGQSRNWTPALNSRQNHNLP